MKNKINIKSLLICRFSFVLSIIVLLSIMNISFANQIDKYSENDEKYNYLELFKMMQDSSSNINYSIILVKNSGGQLEPISFNHGMVDGKSYFAWFYLNGMPTGYFSYDNNVVYMSGGQKSTRVVNGMEPFVFSRLLKINSSYINNNFNISYMGKNRIADREVLIMKLSSKLKELNSYILYIDSATKVLLQTDVINNDNVVESYLATYFIASSSPNNIIDYVSSMSKDEKFFDEQPSSVNNVSISDLSWKLNYIPDGFSVVNINYLDIKQYDLGRVDHIIYSDGIVDFSVYKLKYIGSMDFPLVKQGGTNLYRHQVRNDEIIVVGDISLELAKRIAESYSSK